MAQISLVPTPIGNLEDLSFRALRILKEADLIAAEDTRTSGILLKHYDIETTRVALHQHNEHRRIHSLLDQVEVDDLHLAVISDAGTPGISDPGFLLVREAIARELPIQTLPGPAALIPALVSSGLPCDRFVFEGFLPHKKGRQTRLKAMVEETRTVVLYESPHRLVKLLEQVSEWAGADRQICVSREISKKFETHQRGTVAEVLLHFQSHKPKGEIVVVLAGKS
ncbi:MAG: 16S rRNA (cytidine(1402)-2'-O)-methyltransferase [Bacteroidota bacterium]